MSYIEPGDPDAQLFENAMNAASEERGAETVSEDDFDGSDYECEEED